MDSRTDLGPYFEYLKIQKERLQKSKSRLGQRPKDREPRDFAYARFMMSRIKSMNVKEDNHSIHSAFMPPAYTPCVTPLIDLQAIRTKDLQLEIQHRGKYLALRSITPPNRMTAIMVLAEDDNDEAIMLQLYHQPNEATLPAVDVVTSGTIVIVKEPYYKLMADGSYGLRVDHVSDIVWPKSTDEIVPRKWQPRFHKKVACESLKLQGNGAMGKRKYFHAIKLYTDALQELSATPAQVEVIKRNRALAYLKTAQFDDALHDTGFPTFTVEFNAKALFRAADALYNLGRFKECCQVLELLGEKHPAHEQGLASLERARRRVFEESEGTYPFAKLQAATRKLCPPHLDFATYIGPVEVRQSASKGRGLFTTKPVRAGGLLLCEKAFSHAFVSKGNTSTRGGLARTSLLMNPETNKSFMGGQADLLEALIDKLEKCPSLAPSFKKLFHGTYESPSVPFVDGKPIVDTFLVERVVTYNVFGCPDTSIDSHKKSMANEGKTSGAYDSCGIWLMASYINHACVKNAVRAFIGDMMIVRATEDLGADTEITFWYHHPTGLNANDVQDGLKHWGFQCKCDMCVDLSTTETTVVKERKELLRKLKSAFDILPRRDSQAKEIQRLLDLLNETYQQPAGKVPRWPLWDPQLALTRFHVAKSDSLKILESVGKLLDALGFVITGLNRSQEPFCVVNWGQVVDHLVEAFLHVETALLLCGAVKKAEQARDHARLVYKMVVGEDETFAANHG